MDLIGKVLGNRYEIVELIGSGGMARVYKAKCRQLDRFVAVKVLRDELKDDTEFVRKFKTEALAAASLVHPNIVSVFDSGEDNGIHYFVMEYVEGYTLKQYITSKGALEWQEASEIALGICAAIEQAHKNNIIHRDIKPHNIMLNANKNVKVTDFGIARAVSSSTIVRGGNIIGSVHYFSPEQARGASSNFKSDIYSIGIVFYEMLTGRVPFDAENPFNVAKMQVEQEPTPPKRINPDIPMQINNVVLRAMAKKPEERFTSVTEMIAAIKKAVSEATANVGGEQKTEYHSDDIDNTIEIPKVIEEPAPTKNKKKSDGNVSKVLGIIIGVLVVGALVFGIAFSGGVNTSKKVTVEKFVGEEYDKIADMYSDESEYVIVLEDEKESSEYEEGIIIEQTPAAGKKVRTDGPVTVKVVVSKSSTESMEDFIGQDSIEVEYKLTREGYKVEMKERESDKYEPGQVIKTLPAPGSPIGKGERIVLYVCAESEESKEDDKTDSESENEADDKKPSDEKPSGGDKPNSGDKPNEGSKPNNEQGQGSNSTGGHQNTGGETPAQGGTQTTQPTENPSQNGNSSGEKRNAYEGL